MIRSVEIPEAAVKAAARALAEQFVRNASVGGSKDFNIDARAALAAARPYLAPAGDGGLREALAQLADDLDSGNIVMVAGRALRDLIAAHPAAPAIPQPVDREAILNAMLAHIYEGRSIPLIRQGMPQNEWTLLSLAADAVEAVLAGEQEQEKE